MKHSALFLSFIAMVAFFFVGCASINSTSAEDRLRVVAGIEDQDELFNAIGKTKFADVKNAAARRIVRQDLCLALLREPELATDVRVGLVGNVSAPEELKKIAIADDLPQEMRLAAVTRTRGESFLADIVMCATDLTIRSEAMDRVLDEFQCKRILDDSEQTVPPSIRRRALDRISDEVYLAEFVQDKSNGSELRRSALARIETEERLLFLLAKRPRLEFWVREHATAHIMDQSVLVSILRDKDEDSRVRSVALDRVKDESERRFVVEDRDNEETIRRKALATVSTESQFLALLKVEPPLEDWVLEEAVQHVTDDKSLADVLLSSDYPQPIRLLAGERISDKAQMNRVFLSAKDEFAESFAMERVDTTFLATPEAQERLLAAFRNANTDESRAEAMRRLSPEADLLRSRDQRLIAAALLAKDDEELREFARQTLFDESAIRDVALSENESLGVWAVDLGLSAESALAVALGSKIESVQCRALLFLNEEEQFATVVENGPSRVVRLAAIMNLSGKSSALLLRLGKDTDAGIAETATRRLRAIGDELTARKLETEAESRRENEARRIAAETERQARANREADEKLAASILAITGTLQVHGFRFYVDTRAKHPEIGPKSFRFSGVVKKVESDSVLLEVPANDEKFLVTAVFAEGHSERIVLGSVITIGGVFEKGSREEVTLRDSVMVCSGVP